MLSLVWLQMLRHWVVIYFDFNDLGERKKFTIIVEGINIEDAEREAREMDLEPIDIYELAQYENENGDIIDLENIMNT